MKKFLFPLLIFSFQNLSAQNKIALFKVVSVKPDIEKVASDYYVHFENLKGEIIDETVHTIEYRSKLLPHGAIESSITRQKNLQDVYSWQAVMITTEDYNKAEEIYKELYKQLNGSVMVVQGRRQFKLQGVYDIPGEDRGFTSSILEPDVKEKSLRQLKVEVALSYQMPEWNVKLLVYEKVADADIRPTQ